ncbi:MAG: hypothetical protein AAGA42_12690 [Actinomycetota bacterium]
MTSRQAASLMICWSNDSSTAPATVSVDPSGDTMTIAGWYGMPKRA